MSAWIKERSQRTNNPLYNSGVRPAPAVQILCIAFASMNGCSSSDEPQQSVDAAIPQDGGKPTQADSIAFESASTLTLAPGERATLRVLVLPPGDHKVRFSLDGNSLDGSLDSDLLDTTSEGRAAVVLTAPQSATTFRVRAVADDGPWAETAVSVSGTGFASIAVTPKYAGTRSTPSWTATGAALVACADKKGIPPPDGPIATTAESGSALVLGGLPAGAKLAVTLRSGHAVGGCADLSPLNAGEHREVEVKVADRPIELGETDVSIELLMTPDGAAVKPWLEAEIGEFVEAFAPPTGEAGALLDAMQACAADGAQFASLRQQEGWDAAAKAYFADLGKPLGERIRSWAAKGAVALLGGNVLAGRLVTNQSIPELRPQTIGALDAASCGSTWVYTVVLSADPGDTLHVGGGIDLFPSALVAASADSAVKSATVPDGLAALQEVVGCTAFAQSIDALGTLPSACAVACLDQLCREGLALMWAQARGSSSQTFDAAHVSFTVSAAAQVDAEAVVQKLEGSWTGELNGLGQTIVLSGSASGAASK